MLTRGAAELDIDLNTSFVVGDSLVDMQAGNATNARTVLVLTGYGQRTREQCKDAAVQVDHVAPTIVEAVDFIIDALENEEKAQ